MGFRRFGLTDTRASGYKPPFRKAAHFTEQRAMKAELLVLLAAIAFAPHQDTAIAQTLTNPGGLRGGPTIPGPPGGLTGPGGGGPKLEPMKMDLKPTLPLVSTPTVNTDQPAGSQGIPEHPSAISPSPEPKSDGDAESPPVSRTTLGDLPVHNGGQGEPLASGRPKPSEPGDRFSWWMVIAAGLLAMLLYQKYRRSG